MSGETHVHEGYSLVMTNPLKQKYKNGGKGKWRGVEHNFGERYTKERKKSERLEHHSKVRWSGLNTQKGI